MTEKTSINSEITKSLKKDGLWYYKIPDLKEVQKPFDRVVDVKGLMVGLEEKLCKEKRFNFKQKIRPHQLNELLGVKFGFFLINFRYKGCNRSFLIPADEVMAMSNIQKSITVEDCEKYEFVEVERDKKRWFVYEALLKAISKEIKNVVHNK